MLGNVPSWIAKPAVALINNWDWLGSKVNDFAVNSTVNSCRPRPHPWSNAHPYVSWTSLTDQRWSARHLPEGDLHYPPVMANDAIGIANVKALFQRPTGEQRLCEKSTCLFPAFAQYLTDGFIRTVMPEDTDTDDVARIKRRRNTSNHQIDLCPLYGRTPEQTDALRLKEETRGQRGRLKSQFIGEEEYAPFLFEPLLEDGQQGDGSNGNLVVKPEFSGLDMPLGLSHFPDASLRQHIFAFGGDRTNSAPHVAMINTLLLREHNRLAGEIERTNPSWDDEQVFQTARNVVIVLFIKMVVEEYINHISPAPFRFYASPQVAWSAPWNQPNWITTEFSLLYRWHSLIPDTITWGEHTVSVAATFMDNRYLINAGLARSFADMSTQRSGHLGALNTTNALLDVELNAVNQGRFCNLASYSDYRQYVKLSRPQTFDDISRNPQVVAALKNLYTTPDKVEFYTGLFAEDTVKNSPLPPLTLRMVAVDAFSQALTNPLLSRNVFHEETFSPVGWKAIIETKNLSDMVKRNCPDGAGNAHIGMTQPSWTYQW